MNCLLDYDFRLKLKYLVKDFNICNEDGKCFLKLKFTVLVYVIIVQKVSLTYRHSCSSAIAGNLPPYGTTYTVAERPSDRKVLGSNSSGNTRNSFYSSMQVSFAD